jgi:hypothetical protein
MNKLKIIFTLLVVVSILIVSCEGDCKDEEIEKIEKIEWITTYIDKTKDTLVAYTITENKREYIESWNEIKHTVTIRNNNNQYIGKFALNINYGYYDYGYETRTKKFDYVTISPKGSYTFTYYTQAEYKGNFNNSYIILQQPTKIPYKERKDELILSSITVNPCESNVEALREKYKIIKELYNSKVEIKSKKQ